MKSILIALGAALSLSACVVTPVGGEYRVRPSAQVVVYPQYEADYYWDPRVSLYFYYGPQREVRYMPRGWAYRTHGVPHRHDHHDRGRHRGHKDRD